MTTKQSLMHLHALFLAIRRDMEARGDVPPNAFQEYDSLGIHPNEVYRRKKEHKEAIWLLSDGFDATLKNEAPELVH